MPETLFQFKQFALSHTRSTLKVGTDALLLGAWAGVEGAQRILDLGTGCGVLALIAAQRNPLAMIDAVDIDEPSMLEAAANFAASPWPVRLRAHCMDVRRLRSAEPFDRIICNPPYYGAGMASPDMRRRIARHDVGLDPDELFLVVQRLLAPAGRMAVIVPADREPVFVAAARARGLQAQRRVAVRYLATRPHKRVLLELAFAAALPRDEPDIVVQDRPDAFNDAYRALVRELITV